VVGLRPWLPWPLSRWRWWTEPAPAERLAALRVGVAFVLLCDVLLTYLPDRRVFFGRGSLGDPALFEWVFERGWRWSLLRGVGEPWAIDLALSAWVGATLLLLVGYHARLSAVVVWALSLSFANINTYIDNAGDQIRYITLFYLMLTPCGAAWSVDAWLRRRRGLLTGPALIHPWALRLLFIQLVLIYWCNGLYKAAGADWQSGESLYYVLGDLTLVRWSYAQMPAPYWLTRLLTWGVLAWELTFPLLVLWRPTRIAALLFGVAFHLGIGLTMELGGFVPYVLCLYLPLAPWEKLRPKGPEGPQKN
jgi:hypothetical protein